MNPLIDVGAVGLIIGVIEVVKNFGMAHKFAPLAAIGLGITYSVSFIEPGMTVAGAIWQGVIIGLSAAGLYSGTKATLKPTPEPTEPTTIDSLPE